MSSWPPVSVSQRRMDLEQISRSLKSSASSNDDFLETNLARYLVVRSAGYLEATRDDVADLYASKKSTEEVTRRIRHNLRHGQGVAPSQLLDFVKSYSPAWYSELEALFDRNDSELKSNIGAMVAARKKIAHGDGEQVTVAKALKWMDSSVLIAKWLIARFDPNGTVSEPIRI